MDSIIISCAPIVLVLLAIMLQYHLAVTPAELEKKHREILEDIERKYVTWNSFKDLKTQFSDIQLKVDKIYDVIINEREKPQKGV